MPGLACRVNSPRSLPGWQRRSAAPRRREFACRMLRADTATPHHRRGVTLGARRGVRFAEILRPRPAGHLIVGAGRDCLRQRFHQWKRAPHCGRGVRYPVPHSSSECVSPRQASAVMSHRGGRLSPGAVPCAGCMVARDRASAVAAAPRGAHVVSLLASLPVAVDRPPHRTRGAGTHAVQGTGA